MLPTQAAGFSDADVSMTMLSSVGDHAPVADQALRAGESTATTAAARGRLDSCPAETPAGRTIQCLRNAERMYGPACFWTSSGGSAARSALAISRADRIIRSVDSLARIRSTTAAALLPVADHDYASRASPGRQQCWPGELQRALTYSSPDDVFLGVWID